MFFRQIQIYNKPTIKKDRPRGVDCPFNFVEILWLQKFDQKQGCGVDDFSQSQ